MYLYIFLLLYGEKRPFFLFSYRQSSSVVYKQRFKLSFEGVYFVEGTFTNLFYVFKNKNLGKFSLMNVNKIWRWAENVSMVACKTAVTPLQTHWAPFY